jgi:hypothetical protein
VDRRIFLKRICNMQANGLAFPEPNDWARDSSVDGDGMTCPAINRDLAVADRQVDVRAGQGLSLHGGSSGLLSPSAGSERRSDTRKRRPNQKLPPAKASHRPVAHP